MKIIKNSNGTIDFLATREEILFPSSKKEVLKLIEINNNLQLEIVKILELIKK